MTTSEEKRLIRIVLYLAIIGLLCLALSSSCEFNDESTCKSQSNSVQI